MATDVGVAKEYLWHGASATAGKHFGELSGIVADFYRLIR